jgi:FAD binding domain/Berberine and berberine like
MADQHTTTHGAETGVTTTAIEQLKGHLRGDLLCPGDEHYDSARTIHNGMIDRRPALIVRCVGVADVMAAVTFARSNNLVVAVRGGGHGVPGFAVCDGGLMIDLTRMKAVRVDPVGRTARAEGGATWGDFDHETQAFGLATTGGIARPTGIAGLTLGGGHGYLMRTHGLACDNLLSVDVVTADGRLLTASATEHADLFWAVRGGGGNFGVVTAFEYRLYPVSQILGGLLIYPITHAKDVFRFYRDFTRTAPEALGSLCNLATLPDGTPAAVILLGYNGSVEDGERLLRPLRECAPLLADQVGLMPYIALQSIVENFNPPGLRNYWKSNYLQELSDGAIEVLVDHYRTVPAPHTHVVIEHLGGAVSRVGADETAVDHREALYNFLIVGMWTDAAMDAQVIGWVRDLWGALQPFSSGGLYVNYEAEHDMGRVQAAYSPAKYARLVAVKTAYDPTNLFRLNQNIPPAR